MRMSCNGCRVLRKGCSEDCSIRPCLQWIGDPESQGNATVFLAKFYGRAGLMNLISEGPEDLRPAIFRSLLYEACGRFVNPIYGSVGLLWSGNWNLCQAAVDAVLKGAPLTKLSSDSVPIPPFLKSYDIRHVIKKSDNGDLHKVNKSSRPRFKQSPNPAKFNRHGGDRSEESNGSQSAGSGEISEQTSMVTSFSHESEKQEEVKVDLELALGFEPVHHSPGSSGSSSRRRSVERDCDGGGVDLGLHLPV